MIKMEKRCIEELVLDIFKFHLFGKNGNLCLQPFHNGFFVPIVAVLKDKLPDKDILHAHIFFRSGMKLLLLM